MIQTKKNQKNSKNPQKNFFACGGLKDKKTKRKRPKRKKPKTQGLLGPGEPKAVVPDAFSRDVPVTVRRPRPPSVVAPRTTAQD